MRCPNCGNSKLRTQRVSESTVHGCGDCGYTWTAGYLTEAEVKELFPKEVPAAR